MRNSALKNSDAQFVKLNKKATLLTLLHIVLSVLSWCNQIRLMQNRTIKNYIICNKSKANEDKTLYKYKSIADLLVKANT